MLLCRWTKEVMNDGMTERTKERRSEGMKGRTNKRMNEWMNEWINEWMNEWMNEWVKEQMSELKNDKGKKELIKNKRIVYSDVGNRSFVMKFIMRTKANREIVILWSSYKLKERRCLYLSSSSSYISSQNVANNNEFWHHLGKQTCYFV